jgi:hypothetical protein
MFLCLTPANKNYDLPRPWHLFDGSKLDLIFLLIIDYSTFSLMQYPDHSISFIFLTHISLIKGEGTGRHVDKSMWFMLL